MIFNIVTTVTILVTKSVTEAVTSNSNSVTIRKRFTTKRETSSRKPLSFVLYSFSHHRLPASHPSHISLPFQSFGAIPQPFQ
ncbi:MAG: hypothetical protein LBV43_14325 [Prevotella sp.]|nr:hypothetical protein [Prevotella sp.]